MRGLTEDEEHFINAIWPRGLAWWPIRKSGRRWTWGPWRSIQGPPTTWATKREALANFEAFIDVLIDAKAGRI